MKLGIISGSQRSPSQSAKVSGFIADVLSREFDGIETFVHDLGAEPLPWCEEEDPLPAAEQPPLIRKLSPLLRECDGLIVVTPEWGGMATASLKNFFLWCNAHELSHKPGLIISVARRLGGAYPVADLRMSSYKNTHLCWLPEHVIIRNVESVLNEPSPGGEDDRAIRQRLSYALRLLEAYATALRSVRAAGIIDTQQYRWGM